MALDHNRLFVTFVDKLESRNYVESKIGKEYLPKLYFKGDALEEISFKALPENMVIKVNHLSGGILLCHSGAPMNNLDVDPFGLFPRIFLPPSQLDFELATRLTNKWLSSRYENQVGSGFEWAYSLVKPQVFVEEFIESDPGAIATDFKFFVFKDQCPYFLTISKQNGVIQKKIFNENGERLKAFPNEYFDSNDTMLIDSRISQMRELAIILGNGIDHLRVDFFLKDRQIYVGELTPYDSGGVSFCTREFELFAGAFWVPSW
jgi:hypothetical protein